jgi:hypothetical protein
MLHLPYTAMVLAFVVLGAALAPAPSGIVLLATLAAYFLALGIGAHFLDQLPGMGSSYVRHWPPWALAVVGAVGVGSGVVIGVVGALLQLGVPFLGLVVAQGVVAVGYPLAPKFGGLLHRDPVFAVSWGALPFLTSFYAQSRGFTVLSVIIGALLAGVAVLEIRASRASRAGRKAATSQRSSGPPNPEAFRRPELMLQGLVVATIASALALLAFRLLSGG